jgi:hypothetical protein
MSSYIPGAGMKKPLNQLENPIIPDIKKGPTRFQWSGKHWTVDTAQTLLDTDSNTQLIEPAILAQSRDYGRDQYGHSSYQEKITVFRMPLQNHYEDFGPLNRLPTKIHAIQPRINPGTAFDSNSAYVVNNSSVPEMHKYISDKISTKEWRETFYAPMSGPEDNKDIVEPDLIYSIPVHSASSGFTTQNTKDAYNPKSDYRSEVNKPRASASAGYNSNYNQPLYQQTSTEVPGGELISNLPARSVSSGFSTANTKDGSTGVEFFELERKTTPYSISSGYTSQATQDGDFNRDYELNRKTPWTSVSSGFTTQHTQNGETRLDDLEFQSKLSAPTRVLNPSSETGYQTRMESYTSPEQHLKIRENPKVPVAAHHESQYRDLNSEQQQFRVRTKIQPVKSYGSGLNSGTVKTSGVQNVQVKLKQDTMKSHTKKYI